MPLNLYSTAFKAGEPIPQRHTCEGADVSPPLDWSGAPPGTKSFALIVDDPDAPDPAAPKMTYVHWVVYDIPASATSIPAGGPPPHGACEGVNDWKRTGYGGPCPPIGRHRYYFKLYALDETLGDLGAPTKDRLESVIKGHVIEQAQLMGTYEKQGRKG
jgi:Raf kinase inhibitor-like YbhB/YbcL family protein